MTSKRAIGLAYEKLSVTVLRKHGFMVEHCGRSGDKGVDFKGHWILPKREIPVIGQCKCHQIKLSPSHIRELEGTLQRLTHTVSPDSVGILVSSSGYTAGAMYYCQTSPLPLLMCQIKPDISVENSVQSEEHGYISKVIFSRTLKKLLPSRFSYQYFLNEDYKQEVVISLNSNH